MRIKSVGKSIKALWWKHTKQNDLKEKVANHANLSIGSRQVEYQNFMKVLTLAAESYVSRQENRKH